MTHPSSPQTRHLRSNVLNGFFIFLVSVFLSACGGGGGGGVGGGGGGGSLAGGIGGTGSVAAIASVTVNGVTYSCVGATITDDDGTLDQGTGDRCVAARDAGRLTVGSIVTVTGTTGAGSTTATTINISRSVRGPVANVNVTGQSFTVLGQTILVDQTTNFVGVAGLSTLNNDTIVEVSGFRQPANAVFPNGAVLATLVKTTSVTNGEFELKGFANVTGGNVTINGVTIANVSALPTNGQCVEAKGTFSSNTLTLTQALKSDDDCTGGSALGGSLTQAQVEGVITAFSTVSSFTVGGQAINGGSANILGGLATDLLNGVKVEVKGTLSGGVLIATQIEIKSNGVRIKATADGTYNTGTGIVSVLGIAVKVGTATELSGDPTTIATGTRVEIEGSKSGSGTMNASKLKVITGGGGNNSPELRGPLDAKPVAGSFSILGVPVTTSGSTVFQNLSGASISEATFVATTNANDIVKAKGTENPDNRISATEVEIED